MATVAAESPSAGVAPRMFYRYLTRSNCKQATVASTAASTTATTATATKEAGASGPICDNEEEENDFVRFISIFD